MKQIDNKNEKSIHDWTMEWIQKFLSFEAQLKMMRGKVKSLKMNKNLLDELDELQYLDLKLRYNIRLHEMNLTRFIKLDDQAKISKAEYKDHKELEFVIEDFENQLNLLNHKITMRMV